MLRKPVRFAFPLLLCAGFICQSFAEHSSYTVGKEVTLNGVVLHVQDTAATTLTLSVPTTSAAILGEKFALGEEVKVEDMVYHVKDVTQNSLKLSIPLSPTASIGDLITPVAAEGTPGQSGTGRAPHTTINGSGLREIYPGAGVFVHSNKVNADGASMWSTGNVPTAYLEYDLGQIYNVSGLYLWNYNEPGEFALRGVKDANIVFPADANIVDVTKDPYGAKGDGVSDDTDAIQRAINDNPARGAIIYLPNGRYLVSKQIQWGGDKNMEAAKAAKQTGLWGQSTRGTILQLKDRCIGFTDARNARGVLWTGAKPAQRFGNEIHNLTIDTGCNNPGASGIQFIANNQGGVFYVNIVSGDGQGYAGLDLGYTDEQGPMLIKNVDITGFDFGVSSATGVASWTGENISLRGQNRVGLNNNGQPASVRNLRVTGNVPAVQNGSGLITLIDATLIGTSEAKDVSAITIHGGAALIRNLKTTGFKVALEDRVSNTTSEGPNVVEHRSLKPMLLSGVVASTLNLPIKETPEMDWPSINQWVTPKTSDSAGIQAAIDSGAEFVFLPKNRYKINQTIIVRGATKRIVGGTAYFGIEEPLKNQSAPIWKIEDGKSPVVSIEQIRCDFSKGPFTYVDHASKRTLVLKRSQLHGAEQTSYTNSVEGGDVFLEDVVLGRSVFRKQNVWARQFNPEPMGNRLTVDGGTFWVLGYKTERYGEIAVALNGAKVEILGGLSQTSGSRDGPMFINNRSQMSITFSEVNFSKDPYSKFVMETQNGPSKVFGNPDRNFKGWRPVFYEGR